MEFEPEVSIAESSQLLFEDKKNSTESDNSIKDNLVLNSSLPPVQELVLNDDTETKDVQLLIGTSSNKVTKTKNVNHSNIFNRKPILLPSESIKSSKYLSFEENKAVKKVNKYPLTKYVHYIMTLWESTDTSRKGHFMLELRPKTASTDTGLKLPSYNVDSCLIFCIHHNPKWFSWKYKYYKVSTDFDLETDWDKKEVLLDIIPRTSTNHSDILLEHLIKAFDNRNKSIWSTKYDVCTDIYLKLTKHMFGCCTDILSVTSIGGIRETVIWS